MIPDGSYTAVVDRIEDTLATLVVEDEDGGHAYNLVVGEEELPSDARRADAVLDIELEDEELLDVAYDDAATTERREQAQNRFDRLSERAPRDDDR